MRLARRGLLASLGLLGIGVAAGCGRKSNADSEAVLPSRSASASDISVVTLDPFSTYNLLDLRMVPVTAQADLEEVINPRYADTYASVPKAGTYFEPNFERIAGLQPDLILASTGQVEAQEKLSKIAKTVLVTGETSSTWRQAAAEVATAVGRSDALATLEEAYEARATKIKNDHAAVLDRYTWAMLWQGKAEGFSVRSAESNGGQVLALAGVKFNAITRQAEGDADTELSWEQVSQVADAHVICLPGSTSGGSNEMTDLITAQKTFTSLPAPKAGRVFTFDYMTPGSYLNATELLEELDAALTKLA